MKLKPLMSAVLAATAVFAASNASAYVVFSGVDNNGDASTALATTPNSTAAETAFKSHLVNVGTETFESRSGAAPLVLDFGAAGTATLSGGGSVQSTPAGTTNGAGRYSVPGGTKYWETSSGENFQITFSQDIAAFGFYGIDIGDLAGSLSLQFRDDANHVISTVNIPAAAINVADGSVLYFGAIAANSSELFKSVSFTANGGNGDVFAFDSFTIGSKEQVTALPEPTSIALLGLGLLGCALVQRKSAKKQQS